MGIFLFSHAREHFWVTFLFLMVLCIFLTLLDLHCYRGFSLVWGSRVSSVVVVGGRLSAVVSLLAEHSSRAHGLQWLWLPGSGAQPQ